MLTPRTTSRALVVAVLMNLCARLAGACPVCFGATDGPMLRGSNMGILTLLLVTLAMLSAFAMFMWRLVRRDRAIQPATAERGLGDGISPEVSR